MFATALPRDNAETRRALYDGAVFRIAPNDATLETVETINALLAGAGLDRAPPAAEDYDAFVDATAALRRLMIDDPAFIARLHAVIAATGFAPEDHACDHMRLRAVLPGAHERPELQRSYAAHRDTWYANPQAQLNWWMPLHDVTEDQSFHFYPDAFDRPVANGSVDFDYATWINGVGWQNARDTSQVAWPELREDISGYREAPFSAKAGEIILFSSAHLHKTRPNMTGTIRYSVDFRTVHLGDHEAGLGAPNVDNASTGSALADYVTIRGNTDGAVA